MIVGVDSCFKKQTNKAPKRVGGVRIKLMIYRYRIRLTVLLIVWRWSGGSRALLNGCRLKACQEAGHVLYPVKGDRQFKVTAQGQDRWR